MGSFPFSTDLSKMTFTIGEISLHSSLRINGLIWLGPAALPGLRLPRSFVIPAVEIWLPLLKWYQLADLTIGRTANHDKYINGMTDNFAF